MSGYDIDVASIKPAQEAALTMLRLCVSDGLRKMGDNLYKEITVKVEGRIYGTYAWELLSSIEDFVWSNSRREQNTRHWLNITETKGSVPHVVDILKKVNDSQLPWLRPCPRVFAFNNGVYDATVHKFCSFVDLSSGAKRMAPNTVAVKYFDCVFPDYTHIHDWRHIPTPALDSILKHQQLGGDADKLIGRGHPEYSEAEEERVICWLLGFLGRLMYKIGEAVYEDAAECELGADELGNELEDASEFGNEFGDASEHGNEHGAAAGGELGQVGAQVKVSEKWQAIMFIHGRAQTGKSTIASMIQNMYPKDQIGILSNNIETKFGLSSLLDKRFYICYELKHNFSLSQSEFQCMVSGESMAIAVKGVTAKVIKWEQHGLFLGNDYAMWWLDSDGCIGRRLLIVDFYTKVTEVDGTLDDRLDAEMPAIIQKISLAYRYLRRVYGKRGLWDLANPAKGLDQVLPDYFHRSRARMLAETHPVRRYITSSMVDDGFKLCPGQRVPFDEFETAFNNREKNSRGKLTVDFYRAAFESYQLNVSQGLENRVWNGLEKNCRWISGIQFSDFVAGPIIPLPC